MSQSPNSWEPTAAQPGYQHSPYGAAEPAHPYGAAEPAPYIPPPPYGGYPPTPYGAPPFGIPQYGAAYSYPAAGRGPQRPGVVLAAAIIGYAQAAIVLICSFFVLAVGTAYTEPLVLGILQLVSVVLLVFGGVQLTMGTGRRLFVAANLAQFALVIYYLIRVPFFTQTFEVDARSGLFVIPLIFAVLPAIALGLSLNAAANRFLLDKRLGGPGRPGPDQPRQGQPQGQLRPGQQGQPESQRPQGQPPQWNA